MIRIGKPYLQTIGGTHTRMVSDILVDGELHSVWAEVENKYKDYLCYERADAFVIGLLHYAMSNKHDIICDAPMSEDLYYQMTTYLIEAVAKGSHGNMHHVKITTDIDSTILPSAGKVGTGISCGVDSLHVLAHLNDPRLKNHKITHLAFNNVGSNGDGENGQRKYELRKELAQRFCDEYGFELTSVNSNIMDEFKQDHLMTCIYTCGFSIYVLKKLYSVYYIASSTPIYDFSLDDNHLKDSSFYESLFTTVCTTENLKIYSEGETLSRIEKVEDLKDYEPSYKYLNVCTLEIDNCGKCEKCTRTLLALDALGILDKYKLVFDIEYYRNHKQTYLRSMIIQTKVFKNVEYEEFYDLLKDQISFSSYLKVIPMMVREYLKLHVNNPFIMKSLKGLYHIFKKQS